MTDEKVEIIFTSDESLQKGGFVIEWKFIEGTMKLCFVMVIYSHSFIIMFRDFFDLTNLLFN